MRLPVPDEILPADDLGRVHFVGIGGAGLSAIARIMAATGVEVTGSDDADTPFLPSLRELGVTIHRGYAAEHLGDLGAGDSVVVTTAAREDNPEVAEARRRGLRLLPRSAGLAATMAGRRVVAVAGITAYRQAFALPRAVPGRQPEPMGPAELWVVPNPSGLNAHETVESLAAAYAEVGRAAGLL